MQDLMQGTYVHSKILLACVASVPVRSKRNFTFGPHEKWGESKKGEGGGRGRGKKGTLAHKPLDFEKRPLVFRVGFIY